MPGKKHEIWFYEKFVDGYFRMNKAEDWSRLQVMDGNALKPVMEQGFTGAPSSAQIENLHNLAQQGKLVYFELANAKPYAVTPDERFSLNLDAAKPEPPAPLAEGASRTERVAYNNQVDRYNARLQSFEKSQALLDKLGAGFKAAVDSYNSSRNMEQEQATRESRQVSDPYENRLRRLENTDRIINEAFGPRPVASPSLFYEQNCGYGDFVFKYSEFDQQFAPNGYDLPADSKLTAQEVATINFAMTGAQDAVYNFFKKDLGGGDDHARGHATNGFNMLVTGCFGIQRPNQVLPGYGALDMTFKLGKEAVKQYNEGKPDLLGKNLADSVRNIKAVCTGYGFSSVSQDVVAGARVIGRIQELLDNHEDLRQAANLSEKEQAFMRGYVQLSKAYEQHQKNMLTLHNAAARGKKLSFDEKVGVLADAVLLQLVEKELIEDVNLRDNSDIFKKGYADAQAQDNAEMLVLNAWREENPQKINTHEEELYMLQNDLVAHSTLFTTQDQDHEIIYTMAREGMLKQMRSDLMQNPAIRAAATKEPLDFTVAELENSQKLDALVAQTEATKRSWETSVADKQAWNEKVKNNKSLENFRTNAPHIEVVLDDVVSMASVFSDAVLPKKTPKKSESDAEYLDKENEMKNEPSKTGPTT